MTSVTSRQAAVLAYLARHRDLPKQQKKTLVDTLDGPAHDLANELVSQEKTSAEAKLLSRSTSNNQIKQKSLSRARKSSAKRALAA